jgi:hypothetical protein
MAPQRFDRLDTTRSGSGARRGTDVSSVTEPLVSEHAFDTFTRHAARAISRRASLMTFGGTALVAATVAAPFTAAAKNKSSKKAKKKLKQVKKQFAQACAALPGQCEASARAYCAQQGASEAKCLELALPCCAAITDCNVGPGFTCFLNAST